MRQCIAGVAMFALVGGLAGPAWAGYSFTTIDRPGAPAGTTTLNGINDAGSVVGSSSVLGAFVDTNGSFTTVTVPGVSGNNPAAISNNGLIAGSYLNALGTLLDYLDTNGSFVSFDPKKGLSLSAGTSQDIRGVNNLGQVIGSITDYGYNANPAIDGFVWANGITTLVNVPGAIGTFPNVVNDLGQISGSYDLAQYSGPGNYIFVFGGYFEDVGGVITTSKSPFDSHEFIPNVGDAPGATPGFTFVTGSGNASGQVVGDYYNGPIGVDGRPTLVHGFIATPTTAVPEPNTLMLFGFGLAIFGLCVRHRASTSL